MSEVPEIIQAFLKGENDAGGTIAALEEKALRLSEQIDAAKKVNDLCGWSCSSIGEEGWETSCGNMFIIEAGTPKDNDFIYCPYCGRKIHEVVIPESEW